MIFYPTPTTPTTLKSSVVGVVGAGSFFVSQIAHFCAYNSPATPAQRNGGRYRRPRMSARVIRQTKRQADDPLFHVIFIFFCSKRVNIQKLLVPLSHKSSNMTAIWQQTK